MPRTESLRSLLKAMARAEAEWQEEEVLETGYPLTYEELLQLRRGDKVTVVTFGVSKIMSIHRCKVTSNRPHGYTDLGGFWCREPQVPESAVKALGVLAGYVPGQLVPSRRITFKDVKTGQSLDMTIDGSQRVRVYRGWPRVMHPPEEG